MTSCSHSCCALREEGEEEVLCGRMTGSFQERVASHLVEGGEVLCDHVADSGHGC